MGSGNELPGWVMPWWVPLACFLGLMCIAAVACYICVMLIVFSGPFGPSN